MARSSGVSSCQPVRGQPDTAGPGPVHLGRPSLLRALGTSHSQGGQFLRPGALMSLPLSLPLPPAQLLYIQGAWFPPRPVAQCPTLPLSSQGMSSTMSAHPGAGGWRCGVTCLGLRCGTTPLHPSAAEFMGSISFSHHADGHILRTLCEVLFTRYSVQAFAWFLGSLWLL